MEASRPSRRDKKHHKNREKREGRRGKGRRAQVKWIVIEDTAWKIKRKGLCSELRIKHERNTR